MIVSAVTLLSLAVTASAGLSDQGTGGSFDSATYGSFPYGWKGGADLIWELEVYVATTDDGKIDKTKHSVTSDIADVASGNIAYMGTLLYTNGFSGNCIMLTKSYIADRINNPSINPIQQQISPYSCFIHYDLPETTAYWKYTTPFLNTSNKTFTYRNKFGERTMYVLNQAPCGLPTNISGSYSYDKTKSVIESDQFTEDVVHDLRSALGETTLNLKVKNANPAVYEKAKEYANTIGDPNAAIARLYPDSSDPLVEWAVVATPLALNTANSGNSIGFWITKDNTTDPWFPDLEVITTAKHGTITYAMDAYCQAWYNGVTNKMFANADYRDALADYDIPLSYLASGTGGINSGKAIQSTAYTDWGLLRKEYGTDNYVKLAKVAYIDPVKWPDHCLGIYSPKGSWCDQVSTYAKYGGITIAFSEMEPETSIPVYYYIAPDPNDPITPPSTATPPTFTPEPPPGTVVEKVAVPTDNDLVDPDSPPDDFPDPITTPYKELMPTGDTYPIDPDNPPDHILVECKETDNIPIYYHVFTFYNTTGEIYADVFDYLKYNPKETEPTSEQIYVSSKTLKKPTRGATEYYVPATDSEAKIYGSPVAALSTPLTQAYEYRTLCSTLDKARGVQKDIIPFSRITPHKSYLTNSDKLKYFGVSYDNRSATKSIHVKIYQLVTPENISYNRETDRIKTFDVTQMIDQTISGVAGSPHLKNLLNYRFNTDSYNDANMPDANSTHGKRDGAWMKSLVLSFDTREKVQATNYLSQQLSVCSGGGCSHWVEGYYDSEGHYHSGHYQHSCSNAVQYKCHYAKEDVNTAFGLNVSKIQRTKDVSGWITVNSWDSPSNLAELGSFTTVGFTIPSEYYSCKDVIKLYGSGIDDRNKTYDGVYFLANTDPALNIHHADPYAVFDVLPDAYFNRYSIRWYSGSSLIDSQSVKATDTDKKEDYKQTTGDLRFKYTSCSKPINGVQYLAHRDLLSGDLVATSLAVSGYMSKYADNSNTKTYLDFMEKGGFVVKESLDSIQHHNRTIYVTNSSPRDQLLASANGAYDNAYNTDYTTGKRDSYKVRFGLGGRSEDTVNMYTAFIKHSTKLKDASLDEDAEVGDALRSIYYYAVESEDTNNNVACHGYWSTSSHVKNCVSCAHSPATHSSADVKPLWTSVSNNLYVCKNDQNLTNGIYSSHAVYNQTQNDMFEDIFTSREAFAIPLAVEGTTAGKYDTNNKEGISYNTDLLKLDTQGYLIYKTADELTGKKATEQKSYEQNTFEVHSADYAVVGQENKRSDSLLAEYRYTVPTRTYTFNPSFYMQFDDGFDPENQNKSVWMLSNQQRQINFKNILSIRLTQDNDSETATDNAQSGYSTKIDAPWSTDLEDIKTQDTTGLPVLKAGNSYATETDTSGGSITAYVILQDPEFTGDPEDTQNNEQILKEYNEQMSQILNEMGAVVKPSALADYTSRTDDKKYDEALGFAMYTNMVNGSSTNSQMRVAQHDSASGVGILKDKEPMIITHSKASYDVTTGSESTGASGDSLDNWAFYALAGNKVKAIMNANDIEVKGAEGETTDISDTTSFGKRNFLGNTVLSMSSASGHIRSTLNEINERLTGIMVNGQDDKVKLDAPSDTKPYRNSGEKDFKWYAEDYEGFIVAVYNIEFTLVGDGAKDSTTSLDTDHIVTDFSAVYRSESDWRADTNQNAVDSNGNSNLKTESYTTVSNVSNIYNHAGNVSADDKGHITLLAESNKKGEDSVEQLGDWAKKISDANKDNRNMHGYTAGIYGVGLELTNVPIHFGSSIENNVIGSSTTRRSFFYQPTYFNIRGSVYDTAR